MGSAVSIYVVDLVNRFRRIYDERMQGLPIVNPGLEVQAVGFTDVGDHMVGVLITPWFINLVLLPGTEDWADNSQGETVRCTFPSGPCELTVCRDEELGTYLAAVLFRAVVDFPDQATAVEVADEALLQILALPEQAGAPVTRRGLFTGIRPG